MGGSAGRGFFSVLRAKDRKWEIRWGVDGEESKVAAVMFLRILAALR